MTQQRREPPELRTNDKRTVAVGTGLWVVLLIGLAARHNDVRRAGLLWWYPMALCGIGLGLFGLFYLKVRPAQLARKQLERDRDASRDDPEPPAIA